MNTGGSWTCLPPYLHSLEWHSASNRNSENIYVMSKPLNIDDEVIFLYKKLMKEDKICDFKFMDSIVLLLDCTY